MNRYLITAFLALIPILAFAGTYIGTITWGFYDSNSPPVTFDPVAAPKLGIVRCSTGVPTIITGVLNSAGAYTFAVDSEMGPACGASFNAGGPVDVYVGADLVATVEPTPITVTFSARPAADLLGTLRMGTAASATLLRSLYNVRDATTSEEAWLSAELSVVTLDPG